MTNSSDLHIHFFKMLENGGYELNRNSKVAIREIFNVLQSPV